MVQQQKADMGSLINPLNEPVMQPLLPGEIPGVEVRYVTLPQGSEWALQPESRSVSIFFFVEGNGAVASLAGQFHFDTMAAFAAPPGCAASVTATGMLQFVHILYDVKYNVEYKEPKKTFVAPHFVEYGKCSMYKEKIKSERTINRTIVAENIIPRFCMGSVETTGEDSVGSHAHPMLDQFFFGLPGNNCIVTADGEETVFGEKVLLHIPRGSLHGARVEAGSRLHYLWMDFFSGNDMSYISENHLESK